MKRFTKISIVLIIAMFVISMFLACTPTDEGGDGSGDGGDGGNNDGGDGGNDGGDSGDTGDTGTVVFSENFDGLQVGEMTVYTVTDNVAGGETDHSWRIEGTDAAKSAVVKITTNPPEFNNDTRLEFPKVDLTSYTNVTLEFWFWVSYAYSMTDEVNGNALDGGEAHEGGYDMRVMVKEGSGDWTELCHENTFTALDENQVVPPAGEALELMSHSVDLSAYAGKSDVAVAFWVIGGDCDTTTLDEVKIIGK